MIIIFTALVLVTQLFAVDKDFVNKIPEYGKASVRLKNQKVPEIKAKEGAILENVQAKTIEVKKLIFAKKVKAEKIILNDCMAYLQDANIDLLEGLAVCQINSATIKELKLKGQLHASALKAFYLHLQGQCYLSDCIVQNMEITSDKVELKNTKVGTLKIKSLGQKVSVVILKNSRVDRIVFIGMSGKVVKRDYKSLVQALENGKQELIF